MPNTLVHIGVQGLLNAPVLGRSGYLPWMLFGCVAPDVPWIARRIVLQVWPSVDEYQLTLYLTVQATLFFSSLLCLAAAQFARNVAGVWALLAVNSLLHLLLDAVEIKPGNYVYLVAPLSWQPFALSWIWPEHWLITVLTIAGSAVALVLLLGPKLEGAGSAVVITWRRLFAAGVVLMVYATAPALLLDGPYEANQESIKTLLETADRPGKEVLIDRDLIETRDGRTVMTTFGEEYVLIGDDLPVSGTISFRGRFVDSNTIAVAAVHKNRAGFRDLATAIGLALILAIWARHLLGPSGSVALLRTLRRSRERRRQRYP